MASTRLKVELLSHTADPEKIAATAARLCYSELGISDLAAAAASADQSGFIAKIASMGHLSVFEHASFTFGAEGVSRALTHQLVRHRIASFSQKSQRYVRHGGDFDFVEPPSVSDNPEASALFSEAMAAAAKAYDALASLGVPPEDARYVLPNACETKIIITMNARELLHFFAVRSCERAQWEIRALSDAMLRLAYETAPALFQSAGPGCVTGACPEGKFACGRRAETKARIAALKNGGSASG